MSNRHRRIPPAINSMMLSIPKPCKETLRVIKPTLKATLASIVIQIMVTSSIPIPKRTCPERVEERAVRGCAITLSLSVSLHLAEHGYDLRVCLLPIPSGSTTHQQSNTALDEHNTQTG